MCFLFKDTSAIEIFTDGPALSLHDARPIWAPVTSRSSRWSRSRACARRSTSAVRCTAERSIPIRRAEREIRTERPRLVDTARERRAREQALSIRDHVRELRSEEHTSELQSLMRLSYAVFLLKKKKHNQHIIIQ